MIYWIVVAVALVWSAAAANTPPSANIVPNEFCDPNSPLSISGYLGVEGSKYDTSNSKQLFYWLFERRSTNLTRHSTTTNDTDIPLIIWLNGGWLFLITGLINGKWTMLSQSRRNIHKYQPILMDRGGTRAIPRSTIEYWLFIWNQ